MVINIDFESRSIIDLRKVGLAKYAAHPSTEIICAAYSFDDGPVHLWMIGDQPPVALMGLALTMSVEYHAWNAQFERIMWRDVWARPGQPMHAFGSPGDKEWHCTMARAALYGLPLPLAVAAIALRIPQSKDMGGRRLMLKMTKPRSVNDDGTPVWWDDEEEMADLGRYCQNDVVVERAIAKRLQPMPHKERKIYLMDQRMNDRGIGLDRRLAEASRACAIDADAIACAELKRVTQGYVTAPNQVSALTKWVQLQGVDCTNLKANGLEEFLSGLRDSNAPGRVFEALTVRAEAAKSSVSKLETMLQYAGDDDRMRGLLQYSGAAHTGRWSGRGPQPQNFPRGNGLDVEVAIPLILRRNIADIDLCAPVMDTISSTLRAHLIASPGYTLIAGDYVSIEARVLAWMAGQTDMLQMFRTGIDTYKHMAATIYSVALAEVTKQQRNMGKTAILGLGYQMGWKTFIASCKSKGIDIAEDFSRYTVNAYRQANYAICNFWDRMDLTAREAVRVPGTRNACRGLIFICRNGWLEMILPSGRSLYYAEPKLEMVPLPWDKEDTREAVVCHTLSTLTHQWGPRHMYGGLWVENAVQATARDILAESMLLLEDAGFPLVLTVHDEIVAEVPVADARRLGEFTAIMSTVPRWADGCPIAVESWEGMRYRK